MSFIDFLQQHKIVIIVIIIYITLILILINFFIIFRAVRILNADFFNI